MIVEQKQDHSHGECCIGVKKSSSNLNVTRRRSHCWPLSQHLILDTFYKDATSINATHTLLDFIRRSQ